MGTVYDPRAELNPKQIETLDLFRLIVSKKVISNDSTIIDRLVAGDDVSSLPEDKLHKFTENCIQFTSDDMDLVRYLRARNYDLHKSCQALENTLKWRIQTKIDLLDLHYEYIKNCLYRGNMYMNGYDKEGHPLIILRANTYHDPHTDEEKLLFMVYMMEMACCAMNRGIGKRKMVWISSLAGYASKYNGSLKFALSLLRTLEAHYPERLYKAFFIDSPAPFRIMYSALAPFLDPVTKEKVNFVDKKKKRETLAEAFDISIIETFFEGDSTYVFDGPQYETDIFAFQQSHRDDCRDKTYLTGSEYEFVPFAPTLTTSNSEKPPPSEMKASKSKKSLKSEGESPSETKAS